MGADRPSIRILSVDDHPLLREGGAALLASQPDMLLVGEASNGREAIEQFRIHRPDITLMDLQMPEMNGVDPMIAVCGGANHRSDDLHGRRPGAACAQSRRSSLPAQGSPEERTFGNHPCSTRRA